MQKILLLLTVAATTLLLFGPVVYAQSSWEDPSSYQPDYERGSIPGQPDVPTVRPDVQQESVGPAQPYGPGYYDDETIAAPAPAPADQYGTTSPAPLVARQDETTTEVLSATDNAEAMEEYERTMDAMEREPP